MTPMPSLPLAHRTHTFAEVAVGFDADQARTEAERCLQCRYPVCVDGCPNNNPIPTFISLVQEGRHAEAAAVDYLQNALPACTGRVCAWERQCEGHCVLNARGEGVRIGAIERFIADYARQHPEEFARAREGLRQAAGAARGDPAREAPYAALVSAYAPCPPPDAPDWDGVPEAAFAGRRVAVVGAGPAGLACADFLSRRGVAATVFEAQPQAGGLLADGIPQFVLPQGTVARDIDRLRSQGVDFRFGRALGGDLRLEDLQRDYEAVFLGIGASVARRMGIPGEEAEAVWTAQDFLHRAKLALRPGSGVAAPAVGARVVVVGAGNTAMDAARTAIRLGAADVRIVYRRTEAESPSRPVEIAHARQEGVAFDYLVNPVAFLCGGDGGCRLRAVRLARMRLGAVDAGGRPRPEPVPGSEFDLSCEAAVLAVGYGVGGRGLGHPEMLGRDGAIQATADGGWTAREGVFAGGDAVRGPATVVEAVRDGRLAARAIAEYLSRRDPAPGSAAPAVPVGAAAAG